MSKSTFKGWQRILILIIPYFIVVGIFQFVGAYIVGIDMMELEDEPIQKSSFQHLVMIKFTLIGTLLLLWFFMVNIDRSPFKDLGFDTHKRLKDFNIGMLIGLIIMTTIASILLIMGEVYITSVDFNLLEVLMTILIFTSVSIVEETLIRGYLLRNMMLSFNKYVALILSSVLFSLLHAGNPNTTNLGLLNLFLAGVLLGVPYLYTKNLWLPIGLHLSWNLFQSLLGFNVSGQNTYSIIELDYLAENAINGGAFGIEGSYLSIIAQILTITWLIWYFEGKTNTAAR